MTNQHTAGRAGGAGEAGGAGAAVPLGATDFHVLMVLAEGASYGYSIMKAVESHTGGAISPEIGSMYRTLARLMAAGWVEETGEPGDAPATTRGLPRRWYALTVAGRAAARAEASRLASVVMLARERSLLPEGRLR